MPQVSVIIPAYNAMKFLPITLDGVLKQTFQDFEVIIVDDGSSDSIKEWSKSIEDQRVVFISQDNQGPAAARNRGIRQAKGEFLAFLDADDLWFNTKLEKQVKILENNPNIGLVYTWLGSIDGLGNIRGKIIKNNLEGDVWKTLIEHNIIECGSTPMVRYSCFEKVGNFDPQLAYAQDWDMWLRIASEYRFKVIPEVLVYYRIHPNNRSKNWQIMEPSYEIIMNKAFENVSTEREKFKNYASARTKLTIAWNVINTFNNDYQIALKFQKKALLLDPSIEKSSDYFRLTTAINLTRFLGQPGYLRVRNLLDNLKKFIK